MTKQNKLIPELRFPEFENEEEWEIIPISETCDVYRGSTFSKADIDEKGSESCIHYGELFTKYDEVITTIYSRTNQTDGFRSQAGDVLMPSSDVTPDGLAKASAIMVDNVVLGGDMNILRPQKSYNSVFISYLLNHSKREIIKLVSGTTVKHIYPSQIITCQIPITQSEAEQQKIAFCLSSLDELIEAHSQKLELLKDHKKGLMQNLFPQKGEKVPKLRFEEFEGEWEEKRLGEVAKIGRGKSKHRPRNAKFLYGGKYPFIQTGDIKKADLYLTEYTQTYSEEGLKQSKIWNENTLCITIAANIAETAILRIKACFPDSIIGLIPYKGKANVLFIKFLFDSFKEQIQSFSQGVAQDNLNQEKLSNLKFLFSSLAEQQKIASTLSSLDELITAQMEKIEQLKEHKKGLMQGLFPVKTGRVLSQRQRK